MLLPSDLVVWNNKIRLDDRDDVGWDIASLGELANNHIPIAHRIVVTQKAFETFLSENNLSIQIRHLLGALNHERHDSLAQTSVFLRSLIEKAHFSESIYEPLFEMYSKIKEKNCVLKAYYFKDKKIIDEEEWHDLVGESTIAEAIRYAWTHLFSPGHLKKHSIHQANHHTFSVVIVLIPQIPFTFTGEVRTFGSHKGEFQIEAHNAVGFIYSKHTNRIEKGHYLKGSNKLILNARDIGELLIFARAIERAFYLPQTAFYGKTKSGFVVFRLVPSSGISEHNDTYNSLVKSITVNPGITIGKLRVINEKNRTEVDINEEILMLESVDKKMSETIKKAKGIILTKEPHPEVAQLLKNIGIPTVITPKDKFLYSTGDVISLNATTGEIKRGNMLVS